MTWYFRKVDGVCRPMCYSGDILDTQSPLDFLVVNLSLHADHYEGKSVEEENNVGNFEVEKSTHCFGFGC